MIKDKLKRKFDLSDEESDYISLNIIHLYDKLMQKDDVNKNLKISILNAKRLVKTKIDDKKVAIHGLLKRISLIL